MKGAHRTPGGVTVHVKGKGIAVPDAVKTMVTGKMEKLDKYHDRLQEIEVELSRDHAREAESQNRVEATAHVPGRLVRVQTADADMRAAVDAAVDRLYRQLNRHKERLKSHHGRPPADDVDDVGRDASPERQIVRVKQFDMKPQFEDEAIADMEALDHSFYVFLNARNERVNVVYRRQDGNYGLIEPASG